MYADRGATPTSGPPFDHYDAKPSTMYSTSDEILGKGKKVNGVGDRVVTAQRPAAAVTHGYILPKLQGAPKPVQQKAQKVNQTTVFASGCVKYWGKGIHTFNSGVDKLNDEWDAAVADDFGLTKPTKPSTSGTPMPGNVRTLETYNTDLASFNTQLSTKKAAKAKELRGRFTKLETKLDNLAQKIASMLKKGPDEKSILTLFGAGALPLMATTVFPDVDWTKANFRKALEEFAKTTEGIFLLTGDKKKVAEWLKKNPQFEQAVNWLLKTNGLKPTLLETRLVAVQAYIDAQTLKAGMDGSDPQANLEKIRDATARLRLIKTTAEDGGKINEAAVTFIDSWTDDVGAKRLSELPDVVRSNVDRAMPGAPQHVIDTVVASDLSPVADAIMLRSNPDEVEAGVDIDTNNDGHVDKDDMSTAVQELVETRIRDGRDVDSEGVDQFKGFVDLMETSTEDGGVGFTKDLAEAAVTAKQDMNTILALDDREWDGGEYRGKDPFEIDECASDLLSVVGRNEDASAKVLLDEDLRRSILGLNWHDGDGAADVIRGGTDRNPDDGGGTLDQAKAAYAVMTEIAGDREAYLSHMTNETVSDAVVDVGVTWIDTFATHPSGDAGAHENWEDALGRRLPLGVTLDDAERQSFLQFISENGREDAVRFHAAAINYSAQNIEYTREHGTVEQQREAREAAGRLEGYINAADVEAFEDDYEARVRSQSAAATAAKVGVGAGSAIGSAAFPPAAPFLSVGAAIVDPVIDQAVEPSDNDDPAAIERRVKIEADRTALKILKLAGVPEKDIEGDKVTIKDLHEDFFDKRGADNDPKNRDGWSGLDSGRRYLYGDGAGETIPSPDGGPGGRPWSRPLPTSPRTLP